MIYSDLVPGTQFGPLPIPVRDGWIFDGWFTKPFGTGTQITETSIVPGEYTEYFARWLVEGNTSFKTAMPIALNSSVNVSIPEVYQKRYYVFTAPTTGKYRFASSGNGYCNPHGWLFDFSQEQLAYNDDVNGNRDFAIEYNLVAGQQYYIVGGCNSTSTGSYTLSVTRL
jgi:uncharacterized repeat protein (TIGR02543 family)